MILSDRELGRNAGKIWAFLLSLLGFSTLYFLLTLIIFWLITRFAPIEIVVALEAADTRSPSALFVFLLLIGMAHIPLWLVLRLVYKRKYLSLIWPNISPSIRHTHQIKAAFIYFLAFFVVGEIIFAALDYGDNAIQIVWEPLLWITWLLPIAFAVLLQTSAEELVFRGFLQQYLARFWQNRFFYIALPAFLWAILHYENFDGVYMPAAVVFAVFALGLVLGDWADRTKSLCAPILIHFLNNFTLICVYGNDLEPTRLQIFQTQIQDLGDKTLAIYTVLGGVIMLGAYMLLRPKLAPIAPQENIRG